MNKTPNRILIQDLAYADIELQSPELLHAAVLEQRYLASLDSDKLMAGFAETAGCRAKAIRYAGWEKTEIQGHTLGHYMTALAQVYGAMPSQELKEKTEYIVRELERFQRADGYLFASREEIFDRVEQKKPAWVPWYTMHKILQGLVDIYHYTGSETANRVMRKLGIWIYERCSRWDTDMQAQVLSVEYGGMNDCLYNLYMETQDERFAQAAHKFDEEPLFTAMCEKRDILNGLHANTTIPKIIGAVKRYIALGESEEDYLRAGKNFWEMVLCHHTYITGGNSEWEHFGEPDILDQERTACNCETCNTYNMLKLSKLLFMITGEGKYLDYYEQAFTNTILSSQNPETGMGTYFQPMATGYFKVFSTPYDSFWCCTGSSMENFTKLQEGICFHDRQTLYIGRAASARVSWPEKKFRVVTSVSVEENVYKEEICIEQAEKASVALAIRIPYWAREGFQIAVNNRKTSFTEKKGFAVLLQPWKTGDVITVSMEMKLTIHTLPDNKNCAAFQYGPYVLSAGLGKIMMDTDYTGVDVLVPKKDIVIRDYLVIAGTTIDQWKENIEDYMKKEPERLVFTIENAGDTLVFTPHYRRYTERYGIYWRLYQKESKELGTLLKKQQQKEKLKHSQIDVIPVGNDQYELAHHIRGEKTDIIREDGHVGRFLKEDGYVTYDMKPGDTEQSLCVTYCRKDAKGILEIFLDERLFVTEIIEEGVGYYSREYDIPAEFIQGNNTLSVRFHNKNMQCTTHIFDEVFLKKKEEVK